MKSNNSTNAHNNRERAPAIAQERHQTSNKTLIGARNQSARDPTVQKHPTVQTVNEVHSAD